MPDEGYCTGSTAPGELLHPRPRHLPRHDLCHLLRHDGDEEDTSQLTTIISWLPNSTPIFIGFEFPP